MDLSDVQIDRSTLIDKYALICEFLLTLARDMPVSGEMTSMIRSYVNHYAAIEIDHRHNSEPRVRIYDKPDLSNCLHRNEFYASYGLKDIKHNIYKDCPSDMFMKALIFHWHSDIKKLVQKSFNDAVHEANEKLSLKEQIENFTA